MQHRSAQTETSDQIESFQAAAAVKGGVYLTPSQVDYVRMLCRVISFPIYLDESDEEDGDREGGEDWRSYVLQEHPGLFGAVLQCLLFLAMWGTLNLLLGL